MKCEKISLGSLICFARTRPSQQMSFEKRENWVNRKHFTSTIADPISQPCKKDTRRHNLVPNLLHLTGNPDALPVRSEGNGCWKVKILSNPKRSIMKTPLPTPRRKIFPCNAQIPFLEGEARLLATPSTFVLVKLM